KSRSADALHHALAMNKGLRSRHNRTGFLTWHFTVDDHSIYQSLPTNETGEHADYEGEGNRSSIGIEMCVNRGNNLDITIDRTAQLTARLMRQYKISLSHVVPHMHWRMIRYSDGRDLGLKKCPRILRQCMCGRSEEHTSELQSRENLVCRLLLEKKKKKKKT